ncbi:MAG: TadE/TadG family type IV pilus assembly protein [Acidimicrobiia bacterium]
MVSRWLHRTGRERGAVMVEMALILPLLLLLVIGSIEFGLLFHERLTIASAASSAARTGATMGIRDEADYAIRQALEAGLYDQVDTSVIIRVDIFRADPITGQKTGDYDRYLYQPLSATCKWFPCPDIAQGGAPAGSWVPSSRDNTLDEGGGGLDVLGVEIIYHHEAVSGFIPGMDRDLTERALVRLEPGVIEASGG